MTKVFLDADLLVALHDLSDLLHKDALQYFEMMSIGNIKPYLSTDVVGEVLTMISQRVGKSKALSLLNEFRSGKYVIVHPDEQLVYKGEEIFRRVKSKNVSYSDCLSFAIMKAYAIEWVCSFDIHFKKQGFKRFGVDGVPAN